MATENLKTSRLAQIVLGLIGAYFAISIVLSLLLHGSIQFFLLPSMFDSVNFRGLGNTEQRSGIANGDDVAELRRLSDRLKRLSAPQSAAVRVGNLDIVFFKVPQVETYLADVRLSFGANWQGGAVLVPDGGARFVVAPDQAAITAAFAVESVIAFDVANLPNGMLAGFRSEMLGARDAASHGDLERALKTQNDRDFCDMVRSWAWFHQVPLSRTRIWRLGKVDAIAFDHPRRLVADATSMSATSLCKEES